MQNGEDQKIHHSRPHWYIKKQNNKYKKYKKCKFCPTIFESVAEYVSHIQTRHQNAAKNYFMCSDCGKQYKTKNELTHHIDSKCGTEKKFNCKVCGQNLMSAGSLYNHMLRHKGRRSFMCRFCAKMFFTAGQLKVHERIHTQEKAYVCEVCNKGFCHRQSLITHSTLHTGIKPFQCENCGNSFSCVGNLIKHRKTHADSCGLIPLTTHRVQHPSTGIKVKINTPANSRLKTREKDGEFLQELDLLKTELSKDNKYEVETVKLEPPEIENVKEENLDITYNDLEEHLQMHPDQPTTTRRISRKKQEKTNPEFDKTLAQFAEETNFGNEGFGDCKYCGKRYMNLRWFYKHVKDHESNIPNGAEISIVPLHRCSCCRMIFFTKEDSLAHQQTEHADLLTCQDCDKMFANRDSLRSHQKVFHKGIGRKAYSYICEKCGQQFKQKSYLKCHEERNCDKGPSFECNICKKHFATRHTRNNHMRVHDPEKKLLCKFCPKSFHWKGQLKIHERSHTGEKPFACLYCPKAFAYRESLITHSTIHTGIKPHLCEGCGSRFSCIGNLIKHRSTHANECGAWAYKSKPNDPLLMDF